MLKGHNQVKPVVLTHLLHHKQELSHGVVLTAHLVSQVGLEPAIHLVAQVSTAEADVEAVTAAVIILETDPDLALHRPVASTLKVRVLVQKDQLVLIEDQEVMADMADTSTVKVRLERVTEDLEDLADVEEEDTEVDGDITDAEDLLPHLVDQERGVVSI